MNEEEGSGGGVSRPLVNEMYAQVAVGLRWKLSSELGQFGVDIGLYFPPVKGRLPIVDEVFDDLEHRVSVGSRIRVATRHCRVCHATIPVLGRD